MAKRRKSMTGTARFTLCISLFALVSCSLDDSTERAARDETSGPQRAPNIILISLDTLRADHLGCYGYDRPTSPNIDQLAEEAVLFESAISPSPWTKPSHASLFTGRAPSVHGAIGQTGAAIRESEITLAEIAKSAGYQTAAHTSGLYVSGRLGFAQGFDEYTELNPDPTSAMQQGAVKDGKTIFARAKEWMETHADAPFFLFVHTYQIHAPYMPPGRFATLFDPDYTGPLKKQFLPGSKKRTDGLSQRDRAHIQALYDGEIAYTDALVGDFLGVLKRLGLYENTIVILFSDHGESFWEHGTYGHGVTLYREELHVPLILKLNAPRNRMRRIPELVSLTDVYATVAELLGDSAKTSTDSLSLVPMLVSSGEAYARRSVVSEVGERQSIWELVPENPRRFSITTPEWKYIASPSADEAELYDLRSASGEVENVAGRRTNDLRELTDRLAETRQRFRRDIEAIAQDNPRNEGFSEEEQRRLESLGYVD